MNARDANYMAMALRLAEKGLYTTSPNPRVGAVVVNDGKVVGEGWHQRAGQAHAEVIALQQAGERAKGSTLYVTLDPVVTMEKLVPAQRPFSKQGWRE